MRINQATSFLGQLQTIAGASVHSNAAAAAPAARAAASHVTLPSMSLDHRVAAKVAVADERQRAMEEQRKQLRELQEELDAAQDEAGSSLSWFGAWLVGDDGGASELQQGTHETLDDLRRRLD